MPAHRMDATKWKRPFPVFPDFGLDYAPPHLECAAPGNKSEETVTWVAWPHWRELNAWMVLILHRSPIQIAAERVKVGIIIIN